MSNIHPNENSYVFDAESAADMARLLEQDLVVTKHMGGLFPEDIDLSAVHDILDVACGPGGWAQEVAFAYPDKRVVGIDISQTMLSYARAQAAVQGLNNVSFLFMDATSPLHFPDASFDLVNARFLVALMWKEAWTTLIAECVRITRPGGIIRLTETDTAATGVTNSLALEKLNRIIMKAYYRTGRSFHPAEDGSHLAVTPMLRRFLEKAGCQHVRQVCHMIDYSANMREHATQAKDLQAIMKLVQSFLFKAGVATSTELDSLYQQMQKELEDNYFRGIWYFMSCYGQKPPIDV